jgi:hypothetical protein
MKTKAIPQRQEALSGEGESLLSLLILYEDFATGVRAKKWFDRALCELEQDAAFEIKMWRLDLLAEPPIREETAADAAEADIIILSAHGRDALAGPVGTWATYWLEQRENQSSAFVVLLDESANQSEGNGGMHGWLKEVAQSPGVAVFYDFCAPWRDELDLAIERITARANRTSSVLEEILQQSASWMRRELNPGPHAPRL